MRQPLFLHLSTGLLAAALLSASCSSGNRAVDTMNGASIGAMFGSALGGIVGGARGHDLGTMVGIVAGGAIGNVAGATSERQDEPTSASRRMTRRSGKQQNEE